MPVPVSFSLYPPYDDDIVKMHIYESATQAGPFLEIEVVEDIGIYPTYISNYTTQLATSENDWFAIAWENAAGVLSDLSAAIQGGTTTAVGELVERVLLRNASLDKNVVRQEVEAALAEYFNTLDIYAIEAEDISPVVMSGLTYLAMARVYISQSFAASGASSGSKWAAGIVSMDNSSSKFDSKTIGDMLKLANNLLGRSYSVILLIKEIEVAGGYRQVTGVDLTRGIAMVSID
jgi:hypothetical protein